MRPLRSLFVLVLALALLAGAAPAGSQSGTDLVDACLANGGSASLCRGLYQSLRIPGGLCRDVAANTPECAVFDGITIDEQLVAAQEASWLNEALSLQRGLDDPYPLQDELWTHTHNSYNADAYPPQLLSGLDRNHIYSIRDQLRMGARAIEIDIHYLPPLVGEVDNSVRACHGQVIETGVKPIHLGCELGSPLLIDLLREVRAWMDANPDEVLMIYLENKLDGDVDAHNQTSAAIDQTMGDVLVKPSADCEPLPMDTSRREIRDSGKRVIITGNASPGWCDWVHERGPRWKEGGLGYGNDFPAYPCTERRASQDYANNWIRHWGDETGLSAGAGSGGDVTPTDALNMTRCGVNMIGFDNLVPFDERMGNLVWSWRTDEPSSYDDGVCASHGIDGRFHASDCSVTQEIVKIKRRGRPAKKKAVDVFTAQPFACFDGTDWAVTSTADRFSNGQSVCQAEGLGSFSVPWNGYENERLKAVRGDAGEVWLNYKAAGGRWVS